MDTQDKSKHQQTGILSGISIREFTDEDYIDYVNWYKWLKKAEGKFPSRQMLSTDGFMVEIDNQKICAGFLYTTNSNISTIEFVFANPEADRNYRKQGLKKLLTELESLSIVKGYEVLLILTNNLFYSKSLVKDFGYTKGHNPHYEHVKRLI